MKKRIEREQATGAGSTVLTSFDDRLSSTHGSDSGSMTGDMMVHPGDSASPLEIIEWLDRVDEKLDATSYGSVRRGDIPAKLMRETEPIDIDAYPGRPWHTIVGSWVLGYVTCLLSRTTGP